MKKNTGFLARLGVAVLTWILARGLDAQTTPATTITIAVNIPAVTGPAQTINVSIPLVDLANALAPLLPAPTQDPPFTPGNSGALYWTDRDGRNPPVSGRGPFTFDIIPVIVPRTTSVNQYWGLNIFHHGLQLSDASVTQGFADGETPAGAIDNVNAAFTILHPVAAHSTPLLVANGVVQALGVDYSVTGSTGSVVMPALGAVATVITFTKPPAIGTTLLIWYRY